MRKIIIPTDFSENAFNALKYAAELFKHEKNEFFLLHAYADEVFNSGEDITRKFLEEQKGKVKDRVNKELDKLKTRIEEVFPDLEHTYQTISAFGLLIDEVNDLAERENADMIITSTRGVTNDRKLTFGSNTLQIIKYVQCPVLSIPENFEYRDLKRILFPSNFMLPYQPRELKIVGSLARAFSAEVELLYVSQFPQQTLRQDNNKQAILGELYEVKVEYRHEKMNDKIEAIEKLILEKEIDLLVLVNSRHSYLENLLYTSTIDKIGFNPKIPFLVLQNYHRS